jgi:hypothetical protein
VAVPVNMPEPYCANLNAPVVKNLAVSVLPLNIEKLFVVTNLD